MCEKNKQQNINMLFALKEHYEMEKQIGFPGFINTETLNSFESYMETAWSNDYTLAYQSIQQSQSRVR